MSIINDALRKADKDIISINQDQDRKIELGQRPRRTQMQPTQAESRRSLDTKDLVLKRPNFIRGFMKKREYRLLLLVAAVIILTIYKFTHSHTNISPLVKEIPPSESSITTSGMSSAHKELTTKLSLNGIMQGSSKSWAIINNHIVEKGDMIDGAKLVEISEDYVKLISKNKELILRIE